MSEELLKAFTSLRRLRVYLRAHAMVTVGLALSPFLADRKIVAQLGWASLILLCCSLSLIPILLRALLLHKKIDNTTHNLRLQLLQKELSETNHQKRLVSSK